ncbi:rod shape-determining protein MreD [Weissella coleopterorum]|uniref:Rod shape-determining protein MreD n=1 Tax=Weissella coleopterorum TaxID=2714949 RepID=A0A6G8B0X3_9LACO|nr:rod shape-determining protein MreD [Weissella coleopterorum]QIL50872.1 rod shape-determining protein MreD [Weissella coleopterorum]
MSKYFKITWVHPVLVFFALILDGVIALNWAPLLYKLPMSASPLLVLLVLLMPILVKTDDVLNEHLNLYFLAGVIGLIYDFYYTGYVGVSLIGFPLMVGLATWVQKYFEYSYFWEMVIFFTVISAYLIFDYLAFGVINVAKANFQEFIIFHMFPSILINLILFIIVFPALSILYRWLQAPNLVDYQVDNKQINNRLIFRRSDRM